LTVTGLARCAAVYVVLQGLHRAAVAAGAGHAWALCDVDAAFMHMEWNDMNAASTPYALTLA
jgi:hypothetical protein